MQKKEKKIFGCVEFSEVRSIHWARKIIDLPDKLWSTISSAAKSCVNLIIPVGCTSPNFTEKGAPCCLILLEVSGNFGRVGTLSPQTHG